MEAVFIAVVVQRREVLQRRLERRIDQIGKKLRSRFADVKAQFETSQARARDRIGTGKLGERVRGAFQQAVGRVKHGLDLPSRGELNALAQRIEELH